MKLKLCVCTHYQVPDTLCVCDRRFTQFVIKTMPVCFSTKRNDSGFVANQFHVVWSTMNITWTLFISDWSNQLSYGDFISWYILTSLAKRRRFECLTVLHKLFMKTLNRSGPRTDPWGTLDNTSYSSGSVPWQQSSCNGLVTMQLSNIQRR